MADDEESPEVVLAEATVGADGKFSLSVNLQRTEEVDADPPAPQSEGSGIGSVIAGTLNAIGGLAHAGAEVVKAVTPSGGSDDTSDSESSP